MDTATKIVATLGTLLAIYGNLVAQNNCHNIQTLKSALREVIYIAEAPDRFTNRALALLASEDCGGI